MVTATSEHPVLFSTPMSAAIRANRKTQTRRLVRVWKTEPRLICDVQFNPDPRWGWGATVQQDYGTKRISFRDLRCPFGEVGSLLWVREAWAVPDHWDSGATSGGTGRVPRGYAGPIYWRTDGEDQPGRGRWRPGIHLPRVLARTLLRVTAVRAERLHDITEADAQAEGVTRLFSQDECRRVVGLVGSRPEDHGWTNYLWHGHVGRTITATQANAWPYQFSSYLTARESFSSLWESINGARAAWATNPWVFVVGFERVPR